MQDVKLRKCIKDILPGSKSHLGQSYELWRAKWDKVQLPVFLQLAWAS